MARLVVAVGLLVIVPVSQASNLRPVDAGEIEGANGVLQVHGMLLESACRLEMISAWQTVDLGSIGSAQLQQPGAQGKPVKMGLQLRDCLPEPANLQDERNGNVLWSPGQPAVSVSFAAPADINTPELVQVQGAQGVGLRLRDPQGRGIRLGSRGAPLFLNPGQNTVIYSVAAERTRAPLQVGAYNARIDFRLSYD
ncbi:type 1 fimbrial protein [Serratia proteamaculans]|nr:type 1 fimbrial protein [Serratia proteamaculans]